MRKYDFYVNDHKWSETDWDTNQLGFFYGIDPQFYDLDHATCKIQEVFKKNVPQAKVPKFRLVFCSPKVRTSRGNNRTIRTKVYAIETLQKDRDEMTQLLKRAYKDNDTFVPFQMRSRHPDAFEKMIRAQTHLLANDFIILVNHIGPDVMHYISERILATDGVQSILPCKSVNDDGRYKILVQKSHYHTARECFMNELPRWIDKHAAPDAKETLAKYPGPPEVAPISSDGFSRGENSYMTISVNTAFSIGSAISDSSPPTYVLHDKSPSSDTSTIGGSLTSSSDHQRSWAEMAAGQRNVPTTEISDIGTGGMDHISVISDLASSRAEVENLKSKVAQLEAERIEQQKALADTVQEQVSKAVQDQMTIFTAQMTQLFASLVSTLQQPQGNLPKRPVQEMEDAGDLNDQQQFTSDETAPFKRWENRKSPNARLQSQSDDKNTMWRTPDSTPKQNTLSKGNQNAPLEVDGTFNGTIPPTEGEERTMSRSEDEDIMMHDSGIESKPKSLTPIMEAEARKQNQ